MTMQRGLLKSRRNHQGQIVRETISDIQYFGCPEVGEILPDGRLVLKIKALQPVDESHVLEDGEYDFIPVTAGFVNIGTVMQLRKSGDKWDWRGK